MYSTWIEIWPVYVSSLFFWLNRVRSIHWEFTGLYLKSFPMQSYHFSVSHFPLYCVHLELSLTRSAWCRSEMIQHCTSVNTVAHMYMYILYMLGFYNSHLSVLFKQTCTYCKVYVKNQMVVMVWTHRKPILIILIGEHLCKEGIVFF